jgi:hypothetical protein
MTDMKTTRKLFLDCDGVLADFDVLAHEILGMPSSEYEAKFKAKAFWRELRHYRCDEGNGFFRALPLMPDAMVLYEGVKHLNPTILTGCPFGDWAPRDKLAWGKHHFPDNRMITCPAKDKKLHMKPGDVLIDDREKHREAWEEAGGLWITHTSAESSLAQLRTLVPEWF